MDDSLLGFFEVFSWNINGLATKFWDLKGVLRLAGFPKIVCLQEIHSSLNLSMLWSLELSEYYCYYSHFNTKSRGTAIFVHRSLQFQVIQEILDTQGRYVILKGFLFGMLVTFGSIYAPSDTASNRKVFFDELIGLNLGNIHYLFGDYNSVLDCTMDRPYGSYGGDEELISFKQDTGSIEAWRHKNQNKIEYSYARHIDNGPFSRIDLCFVSNEAVGTIVDAHYVDSFRISDHKSLIVKIQPGSKLIGNDFKKIRPGTVSLEDFSEGFTSFWAGEQTVFCNEFVDKIDTGAFVGSMQEAAAELTGDQSDFSKPIFLNNISIDGKWWDSVKKSIFKLGRKVQREHRIKTIGEYRGKLQEFLLASGARKTVLEREVSALLTKINKDEWFKAKVEQRKTFEKSSGAFFRLIRENRSNSFLNHVNIEGGRVLSDVNQIQNYFVHKYSELFANKTVNWDKFKSFDKFIPKIDSTIEQEDGKITLEEVKKVVFNIASDKCPGEDGIPIEFYKKHFNIIGPYLVELFNRVCSFEGEFPKSWDFSILKLIPKSGDINFDNLRPLQMINFDCKILAAIWANRMGNVVPSVINKFQTGGVKGRCIQNSTLLIHLLLQYQKQQGKGGFIVSLDNYHAFDQVIRQYLFHVLRKYGFSEKTIHVIQKFYKNNKCKVIVNGFLSQTFNIENGIRQGCPLSALLYVLLVEPLSVALFLARQVEGFVLPNNSEVKLVQHLDDLTLFAKNEITITFAINLIKQFGEISGSILNEKKSFIIKICSSNDSYKIAGIPVLKHMYKMQLVGNTMKKVYIGEFKKILGIYFCASIKHYVQKNWMEVYHKCSKVIDMWEPKHLSLMGKVLILNVKVLPKTFYLLQALEPVRYWQCRFISLFKQFIGGGSSSVPLNILEWGRDRGGLGLISIWQKARSLRLGYVKSYLNRLNYKFLTPINSIIGYYLDIQVTTRYRTNMARTGQLCYGGNVNVIERGNMRKTYLQYFLEDVAWYTKIERQYNNLDRWSPKEYYQLIRDHSADLTRDTHPGFLKLDNIHFSREEEKSVWKNVFLNSLCTKIQSFNLKVVHEALPTLQIMGGNKSCHYCKNMLNVNIDESDIHILIECRVAKLVWHCINERLRNAYLETITVNKLTVLYKIGVGKPQAHLISEVNWALWRSRCSHVYDGVLNTHHKVLKLLFYRLKLVSKIDKVLLSVRVYNKKWLGLNQAIQAIDI